MKIHCLDYDPLQASHWKYTCVYIIDCWHRNGISSKVRHICTNVEHIHVHDMHDTTRFAHRCHEQKQTAPQYLTRATSSNPMHPPVCANVIQYLRVCSQIQCIHLCVPMWCNNCECVHEFNASTYVCQRDAIIASVCTSVRCAVALRFSVSMMTVGLCYFVSYNPCGKNKFFKYIPP